MTMKGSTSPRKRPLEVIALGLPRTGTASMRLALETLGYGSVMHAHEVIDHPSLADAWVPLIHAKWHSQGYVTRAMLDDALGNYGACTDIPCAAFWEELIEHYPEAKIVLVERDIDAWYKSFRLVIVNTMGMPGTVLRYIIEPLCGQSVSYVLQMLCIDQFRATTIKGIMANARSVYAEHYAGIKSKVPKELLLEMKLADGWAPLCEFLGKDIPSMEFPRINDAEDFQRKVDDTMKVYARTAIKAMVWPFMLLAGGYLAWRKYC